MVVMHITDFLVHCPKWKIKERKRVILGYPQANILGCEIKKVKKWQIKLKWNLAFLAFFLMRDIFLIEVSEFLDKMPYDTEK